MRLVLTKFRPTRSTLTVLRTNPRVVHLRRTGLAKLAAPELEPKATAIRNCRGAATIDQGRSFWTLIPAVCSCAIAPSIAVSSTTITAYLVSSFVPGRIWIPASARVFNAVRNDLDRSPLLKMTIRRIVVESIVELLTALANEMNSSLRIARGGGVERPLRSI